MKPLFSYSSLLFLLLLSNACSNSTKSEQTPSPNKTEKAPTTFEWKTSSFEQEGFNRLKLDSLLQFIQDGTYRYTDELFIAYQDKIILNQKFKQDYAEISKGVKGKMGCGIDQCKDSSEIHLYNYYHPKYHPYYKDQSIHTLQSITKSVTSTVVAYALQEKKLDHLETSAYTYLSNYKFEDYLLGEHYKGGTIEDILTMRLGLDWKEMGLSLEDFSNVTEMEKSEDWVQYTLQQKAIYPAGTHWNYNSGASQLLSAIIENTTQENLADYAQNGLFKDLGITDFYWKKTPKGLADAEGGLYLKAEDLAKIGRLYLTNGKWQNKQILPEDWVKKATYKHSTDIYGDGGKEGYGYQWWIAPYDTKTIVGLGYGNQILLIIPEYDLLAIVYSWNVFDQKNSYILSDLVDVLFNLKTN